ncbi:DUF2474 domain-containing protein [Kosakonia sp. BK9b]|nr:DUF2474 domain-containing protein [Kosakonia sp.]
MRTEKNNASLLKGLVWLVIIWTASVVALGIVSMLFRLLMSAAGMKA